MVSKHQRHQKQKQIDPFIFTVNLYRDMVKASQEAKAIANSKVKKVRKKRVYPQPNQVVRYGATIHSMRGEGYTFDQINRKLGITGATSVYARYKRLTGKETNRYVKYNPNRPNSSRRPTIH